MSSLLTKLIKRLVSLFLAGLLAILPLVITAGVVIWVAAFLDSLVGPETFLGDRLSRLGVRITDNSTMAYLAGWAVVLAVVFVIGILVEMGARKILARAVDAIVAKIPIVGGIYGTSKQLVGMMDKKDEADLKGMSVVFCTFGQAGGCGLLALLVSPEQYLINERPHVIVIVPTAPVPVGGGLLFVPADSVTPADVSVDGLMSIYVSMGVTASEFLPRAEG